MAQTYGLLKYEGRKTNQKAVKVYLGTSKDELVAALKDHRLLQSILPQD
jgi:hypothetical protein